MTAATNTPVYAGDAWNIVETTFDWEHERSYQAESIFALGNGYLGLRGTFEEGLERAVHPNDAKDYHPATGRDRYGRFLSVDGTYLNGFYESQKIKYPESAYGYADKSQTMLNVPNGKIIRVFLGDDAEPVQLDAEHSSFSDYTRTLNMQDGLLTRSVTWRSLNGRQLRLEARRLVSLTNKHLAAIEFTLIPDFSGRIRLESVLDGDVQNVKAGSDPRIGSHLDGSVLRYADQSGENSEEYIVIHDTKDSKLRLASGMSNVLSTNATVKRAYEFNDDTGTFTVIYTIDAVAGQPITLHKYLAYVYADRRSAPAALIETLRADLMQARAKTFAGLAAEQRDYLEKFWQQADVTITGRDGDSEVVLLQQGIHFNMFHLLQAAGGPGKTNIGSKGLTSEGYEGHYFWDTEMFAAPFFQHVKPEICRDLLGYRYRILSNARTRARTLALQGAAYAWRTINGEECSAYYPAGTAQYHINADIAYAIKSYVMATGDTDFLLEAGAEIVFETARMWASIAGYSPISDTYAIHNVTGPDEYTAIVDNDCYTNMLAQAHLRYAVEVAEWAQRHGHSLTAQPSAAEVASWTNVADKLIIPQTNADGVFEQNDGFFGRPDWPHDFGKKSNQDVLLKRFHYLTIYRHRVCKQGDVVLALYLLPEHAPTLEQKCANYDYYEAITTHDSSLSTCTFSIMASEIGEPQKAYAYFWDTALMDLADKHGNVTAGVHIANMAGTWMSLVNGFAGLRLEAGAHLGASIAHYRPTLPEKWEAYSLVLKHMGQVLRVTVRRDGGGQCVAEYALVDGNALQLKHYGEAFTLTADAAQCKPIPC
ncbi:MAG: glycoside hydrolase family 65 protein [Chloroflexi bacterium]|uniref:glycoside hydrolase family 65 protein n=1 Tax=Candidatus Flexifilum breve TaxID=3140694 RepID=UPI0031353CC4|nr:glycoside hydrolase family 65 protein [Chloroflexota bacterium]